MEYESGTDKGGTTIRNADDALSPFDMSKLNVEITEDDPEEVFEMVSILGQGYLINNTRYKRAT